MMKLQDLTLGELIGRGGEGKIYAIARHNAYVAKIYHNRISPLKSKKLEYMTKICTPQLQRIAAWPNDIIVDRYQQLCGFLMPRFTSSRDIHELYSPKSRLYAFPEADFRFLVHVATNVARAFALVHKCGHVVGDVNHGNVLVGRDGTVNLIDCDSFQVSEGSRIYTCDVGMPLFTPPEISGQTLTGLQRNQDHDNFGLAVLIFLLLFMGRHPYAGRYRGSGEMPIERAIVESRYAYGPSASSRNMDAPPHTPRPAHFGTAIADALDAAFVYGGRSRRVTAIDWVGLLDNLSKNLRSCKNAQWHHYLKSLPTCPWCKIEDGTGARLFGFRVLYTGVFNSVDVSVLWNAIMAVPVPPPDPVLPSEQVWSFPPNLRLPTLSSSPPIPQYDLLSEVLGLLGNVLSNLLSVGNTEYVSYSKRRRAAVDARKKIEEKNQEVIAELQRVVIEAQTEWESLVRQWCSRAKSSIFFQKISVLKVSRDEVLTYIPKEYKVRIAELEKEKVKAQERSYLDRFAIGRARISGIGSTREAMLASYGIETALDIERKKIMGIPGFGDYLTERLVEWRQSHQRNFRYNASEPLDPQQVMKVIRECQQRQERELKVLNKGRLELQQLRNDILARKFHQPGIFEAAQGIK